MKVLILASLIFIVSNASAQFTSIPDANFESALITLGHDTLPLDGQVPTANINTLILFDVSSKNISDLTGIEDFTLVEGLDLGSNALTSLDLSQNSHLRYLYILYNPLTCVNLQNGNKENIQLIAAFQCPNLTCIQVDDATYSDTNWIDDPNTQGVEYIFDPQISFSEYCDDCNVGLGKIEEGNFSIYPNPVSDYLNIEGLSSTFEFSIFNSVGQLLFKGEKAFADQPIDVQKYNSGILLIRIEFDDEIYYRRVLKE